MAQIPENVKQDLAKLIPASVISEISCFVLYDNHPQDPNPVDITICTVNGEVREYYKRDLLSSVRLSHLSGVSDIKLLRNKSAELFYLIFSNDVLYILSAKDKLKIHQRVCNVQRYELNDSECSGQARLTVVRKDDAVPLVFDDNFEKLSEKALMVSSPDADESLPMITHLKRKLTEATYSVQCNDERHKELMDLRQLAAFSAYQKIHPNSDDSVFKRKLKEITDVLNVEVQTPWVKLCNGKVVMVLNATNQNDDLLEDVHILLHNNATNSMVYKTKLFEATDGSPFWRENKSQNINPCSKMTVVAVIALTELKNTPISPMEFNGVLSYKRNGKEFVLPFDRVVLSSQDIMGEEFDVMASKNIDDKTILAIMATSVKSDLILKHAKNDSDADLNLGQVLCTYIEMEQAPGTDNVLVHKKSPYHTLHGIMIVIEDEADKVVFPISLFTRSPAQVLGLIHYIHDAIPVKILITTRNQIIGAKGDQQSEATTSRNPQIVDHKEYASKILKRTTMLLEYLDNSMIKMHESKDPAIQSKLGQEIGLLTGGVENYQLFRERLLEETRKCLSSLSCNDTPGTASKEEDVMVID